MLVDIPFLIYADAQDNGRDRTDAVDKRVMTVRVEIDNPNSNANACSHYPPRPDAHWFDGEPLLMAIGGQEWKKLLARARANPVDYCADAAEGERLQAEMDAMRDPRE